MGELHFKSAVELAALVNLLSAVLAVSFDQRGVVRDIERYGLEDGRIINLTTRTTETGGRELGVLEQLFGNLLNLDAEQLNN